jgi:hypothetical protein
MDVKSLFDKSIPMFLDKTAISTSSRIEKRVVFHCVTFHCSFLGYAITGFLMDRVIFF